VSSRSLLALDPRWSAASLSPLSLHDALPIFTVLVNYWWASMPAWIPTPMHALYHAIWTLRDRPEVERQAWREVFEYYVFGDSGRAAEHLPEAARNYLAPFDEVQARRMRALLINKLNR